MIDNLVPISEEHSISKVIATIFVPQSFLKPDDVFKKNKEGFNVYQKKSLINTTTINFKNNSLGFSQENKAKGFIFEEYDDNGVANNILKLENTRETQSIISFENRNYLGWESFRKRLLKDIKELASNNDFYVEAISLTYIDEFIWTNPNENINVQSVFDKDSELLNQKFINSKNGTLILVSQGENERYVFEEKTEISFNNDLKRIVLNHQFAIRLSEIKMFTKLAKDKEFLTYYDSAHNENKKVLKDLLTKECQQMINLK